MLPRPFIYLIIAALVISWAAFYLFYNNDGPKNGPVLKIKDSASGRIYGQWPLQEAGEFAIEFIHSVNLSPVRETFINEEKMIRLFSVHFSSFGAGMQTELEEGLVLKRDEETGQTGFAYIITGFSASFRELYYIVGTVSDHLLFLNGETVSLRELCGKNAQITIRIR